MGHWTTMITSHTPQAVAFTDKAENLLSNLYARWRDEKDYEDINAYLEPFRSIADECGVELKKMTKKPFGLEFAVKVTPTPTDTQTERLFKFTASARYVSWKRVA